LSTQWEFRKSNLGTCTSRGYFRQKAQRLKLFVDFLDARYSGSLTRMFARPTMELREELLALNGVGPETADSILLYAGNHPDLCCGRLHAAHSGTASDCFQLG
jgi:endonuclease III-like uncharacterized protein